MPQVIDSASVEVANLSSKADLGFFSDVKPIQTVPAPAKSAATVEPAKPIPPKDPETGRFVKAEEPKSTHSQEALDAAAFFGISEDLVKDIAPHKLNAMVMRMQQKHMLELRQDNLQRMFEASQARTAAVQPQEPVDEFAEFDGLDLGKDEQGNLITARDIHPGILRLLKGKLSQLDSTVKELRQNEEARLNTQLDDAVDEAFEALGAKQYYGEGGLRELTDSPEKQRRLNIYRAAGIEPKTDSAKKIASKIKKAHDLMYPDSKPASSGGYEDPAPASPGAGSAPGFTPEQFAEAGLNAPTSREQEEVPLGEEKAIRALEKKFGLPTNGTKRSEIMAGLFKG